MQEGGDRKGLATKAPGGTAKGGTAKGEPDGGIAHAGGPGGINPAAPTRAEAAAATRSGSN